ncbi:MATE family efflux transporter [Clostridium sp. D53t1_180928_C8]|uniref:MATE family efflux transporter n=1 Tax=Clostridium sp. D53t1_180928_C8 TaxID=2787101 RepID=UPI0018AB9C0E|nr:MATE family efflux transporter [Clostridium sp. D53t1_180928_C8]
MELKENKMESKSILPLLLSMSIPAILSMIIQSMYNIIDSMFVAQLGNDALTAVSLAFPIQNILLGAAVGTGIGVNSLISRTLGEKNIDKSNTVVTYGLILGFITWVAFLILGILFIKPFFAMYTDSANILNLATEYTNIVVYFSFGIIIHIVIEKILQGSGSMIYPMVFVLVGAIINIILDPIFIFGYFGVPNLGVKGAAIATVIGQITAMVLAVVTLVVRKGEVKIKKKNLRFDLNIIKEIYVVGIPATIMFVLGSVLVVGLNSILIKISAVGVSILGIFLKLQSFVFMPISGLTQGAMPIMGFNYGAGNKKRLMETLKISLIISIIFGVLGNIIFIVFPEQLLYLFNSTREMLITGSAALRVLSFSFIFMAINNILCTLFQAVGKGMYSLIISLLRQIIIILPLSYIFAKAYGINGVWITFIIAESFSTIVSIFLFRKMKVK